MLVKTDDFKTVIKSLLPATKGKNASIQTERIVFKNNFIMSFNDKMAVSWDFDLDNIYCSVSATDLDKVLSGIREEEIEIHLKKDKLVLDSGSTKAKIATFKETKLTEEFFESLNFDALDWKELPVDFVNILSLAKFSCSSNEFDPQNLFCVNIDNDFIYSGNGYRCTKMRCDAGFNCLIPKQAIDLITKFPDITDYALVGSWIHFANAEGGVISSKIVKGKFPNITKILESFPGGVRIELSKTLIKPLKEIDILLAKDADFLKTVNITIEKGRSIIKGEKEGLTITKTIPNKFKADKVSFDISPVFLKDLLELEICKQVRIINNIAIFESDGFNHLVTLPIL